MQPQRWPARATDPCAKACLRKGFWAALVVSALFICPSSARVDGEPRPQELCEWMNGRRYYLGLRDLGSVTVSNVTADGANPSGSASRGQARIPQRCTVDITSCPSCHILVTVRYINIPSCSSDGSCQCDYVWVKEPSVGKSGREFCGIRSNLTSETYESVTKSVSIDFLYSFNYIDAFMLEFRSQPNVYSHEGQVDFQHKYNATGFVESPHFPVGYPSDYSVEHRLRNMDSRGFVQLVFTDFQLAPWSYVELLDSNGSRVDVYNGNTFRPPIMVSTGPTLVLRFRANDEYPESGFRAKYTFVNYPEKYWFNKPSTDCGGVVEDLGGAITMMNMATPGYTRNFDCIWLIHPGTSYTYETHISVRVAQFEEMGQESSLEIRRGLTSLSYLLESLTGHQNNKTPQGQEYIIAANIGFYIRLQGSFSNRSRLAIVYSVFSYETIECQTSGDFECSNGRCIKAALHCDGFNHCGDGSDESACYAVPGSGGRLTAKDNNWWRSLTPNYYFPKQESSTAAGTNTLILITSIAGLGMFVLTTVMILVKLHKQRRLEVVGGDALRAISADVDSDSGSIGPGRYPFGLSDAPLYDPPPSYDDVIKFYMPPPPAYSAIVEARSATPVSSHPNPSIGGSSHRFGIENAAYVPDDGHCTPSRQRSSSGRHRSSSSSKATQLLRVILPPVTVFERGPQRRHKSTSVDPKQLGLPSSRSQPPQHRHGPAAASGGPTTGGGPSSPARDRLGAKSPPVQRPLGQPHCRCGGACSCATSPPPRVHRLLVHSTAKSRQPGSTATAGTELASRSAPKAKRDWPQSCTSAALPEPSTVARIEPPLPSTKPSQLRGPRCPTLGGGAAPEHPGVDSQATETAVTKDTQPLLRRTSSLPELAAVLPARLRVTPHKAMPAAGQNSAALCDQVDLPKVTESTRP